MQSYPALYRIACTSNSIIRSWRSNLSNADWSTRNCLPLFTPVAKFSCSLQVLYVLVIGTNSCCLHQQRLPRDRWRTWCLLRCQFDWNRWKWVNESRFYWNFIESSPPLNGLHYYFDSIDVHIENRCKEEFLDDRNVIQEWIKSKCNDTLQR